MLYWLGDLLEGYYGPFRLLQSRLVLASLGMGLGAFLVWWLLPRVLAWLPRDRGRIYSFQPQASEGKPTGAGLIFIPLFALVALLAVPWYDSSAHPALLHLQPISVIACALLALYTGYADDNAKKPWSDLRKTITDFGIALATSFAISQGREMELWLPFLPGESSSYVLSGPAYLALSTAVVWISINATNCTDGVDGLSGSLLLFAFLYLGVVLYVVVGNEKIADYLLVPHNPLGADWAVLAFCVIGVLVGYLWYNAHPSSVLMGDAGSRPLGLLLGALVLATGNPVLLLAVAGVVLVNGATGLVKLALLRFFRIPILRSVRFPLHDHCRKNLGWSNTQVLVRFMILQCLFAPIVIVLLIKIR